MTDYEQKYSWWHFLWLSLRPPLASPTHWGSAGDNMLEMGTNQRDVWKTIDELIVDAGWKDDWLYCLSWDAYVDPNEPTEHPWEEGEFWTLWNRWDQVVDTVSQDDQYLGDPEYRENCHPEYVAQAVMSELADAEDPAGFIKDVRLEPYVEWRARLYGGVFWKAS